MDELKQTSSYNQIAKSTGIFAGSQLITILTGLIRTKVLALLLGTIGIGLAGLYQSIIETIKSVSGLGLSFSAVKEISEASASGDDSRVSTTLSITRKLVFWTGLIGMILMIVFSKSLSLYVFKDVDHQWAIRLLSVCVFAGLLSAGQLALLQGTRQLLYLAKASVLGSIGGLLVASFCYLFIGLKGIVPALIGISFLSLFFSWYYSRKINVAKTVVAVSETIRKGGTMIKLGFFTMISGLVSTVVLLLMKQFVLAKGDLDLVGMYQAVWSISFMYLGAILTSMATDYFPRLCAYTHSNQAMNQFINEQLRFVLLVTTPIVIAVLLFATPILSLLYSSAFTGADRLMKWQIAGSFLKVLIWPIGFVLLAKGKGVSFFLVEVIWNVAYYLFTWLLWPIAGLESAGIAFLMAYVVYVPLVYLLAKPLCQLHINRLNHVLIIGFLLFATAAFLVAYLMHGWLEWVGAGGILLTVSGISMVEMNKIIPYSQWKNKLLQLSKRKKDA
jgi:enterobacterial common antigen flippase